MNNDIYQLLDAVLNRTVEGMRVCEDTMRFIYHEKEITADFKQIRHDLVNAFKTIDQGNFLKARNVQNDKTKFLNTKEENKRQTIEAILKANFHRAMEGCRTLEEYAKMFDQNLAKQIQQIRFKIYNLEKEVLIIIKNK